MKITKKSSSKADSPQAEKMTLERLGRITQQGFLEVNERFSEVDRKSERVKLELIRETGEVKRDVREMKENFSELFVKLDKFIALYEKQEQEMLILGAQLQRLEERISKLESKQLLKHITK